MLRTYAGTSFPAGDESSRKLAKLEKDIGSIKEDVAFLTKENDEVQKRFDAVKQERVKHFDQFFDKLAAKIDEVYKSLTKQSGGVFGRAILYKENKEEPL